MSELTSLLISLFQMLSMTATREWSRMRGPGNWPRTSRGAPTTRPAPPTASMSRESFRMVSRIQSDRTLCLQSRLWLLLITPENVQMTRLLHLVSLANAAGANVVSNVATETNGDTFAACQKICQARLGQGGSRPTTPNHFVPRPYQSYVPSPTNG